MAVELDQRHASTHQVRLDDDPAMVSGTVTTTDRLGCVLDEDKLVGVVSMGDLGRAIISDQAFAIDQLKKYISQA